MSLSAAQSPIPTAATSMASVSGDRTSDDTQNSIKLFSILPFGLKTEFDLTGWVPSMCSSNAGQIKLIRDLELKRQVTELVSRLEHNKVCLSFPEENKFIGTPLPILVLHIKHLNKFTGFEVELEDEDRNTRIIRSTNAQSVVRVTSNTASLPLNLVEGWNMIAIDLDAFTFKLFSTKYQHCNSIKIFANCRIARVYFTNRICKDSDLPSHMRVFEEGTSNARSV